MAGKRIDSMKLCRNRSSICESDLTISVISNFDWSGYLFIIFMYLIHTYYVPSIVTKNDCRPYNDVTKHLCID